MTDAYAAPMVAKPKKKRRVFIWIFLAVQIIFIIWLIVGISTVHTGPTHAQIVSGCYNGAWKALFKSQADCVTHYGNGLQEAGNTGKAIGAGLVVLIWVVVDVLMTLPWAIWRLSHRS